MHEITRFLNVNSKILLKVKTFGEKFHYLADLNAEPFRLVVSAIAQMIIHACLKIPLTFGVPNFVTYIVLTVMLEESTWQKLKMRTVLLPNRTSMQSFR